MSTGISLRTGEGGEAALCSLGGFLWWPQGSRSLLALLCPGQTSQDEAVALTAWKEWGPFSCQRDPPSHALDRHVLDLFQANVCGWSDVICSWNGSHSDGLASQAACWALLGTPLGVRGSPGHGWLSPSAFWWPLVQDVLLGMGRSPGHMSGSPWHRELSWAQRSLLALCQLHLSVGGFPGHSWGSLLATLARSAGANSVNTGKGMD